jgi:hypothetical protein
LTKAMTRIPRATNSGRRRRQLAVLALLALSPLAGMLQAKASYTYEFTTNVGTGPDPSGTNPWLTAVVEDKFDDSSILANQVRITLTPTFTDLANFVSYVGFSIDPFVQTQADPNNFCTSSDTSKYDCKDASFSPASLLEAVNNGVGFPGGGDPIGTPPGASFDLVIDAGTGKGGPGSQLGGGESAAFLINGIPDPNDPTSIFSAASFGKARNRIMVNGVPTDGYSAVAKVQGLSCPPASASTTKPKSSDPCSTSTEIANPGEGIPPDPQQGVPAPLPLLGAGSALAISRRLRQRLRLHHQPVLAQRCA